MLGIEVEALVAPNKTREAVTVKVAIDREEAPGFVAGTNWEVVASSRESLWHGPYAVTLPLVDDGDDERGSR